ncbi:PIN domain-containing protein [Tumidithrix elongata RA019]|uniref:PIN domain-containing protein n=1 Tax=Tumidithrix elongata BACA0141 TaxID=2716417 RepID=A0AAW9QBQ9_9CYAN|nr:PIN domain-containing protein [Tumidithrix elongata RA019]
MSNAPLYCVVIDTNVVFEGLTKQGSSAGFVIDAWLAGLLEVCVSNALAYEYIDVLSRKLSKTRWDKLQPVLSTLLSHAQFTTIYYSWRPTSPDAGDDLVVDCAMNAGAIVVTSNLRDFQSATESLELQVITPVQLVIKLALGGISS